MTRPFFFCGLNPVASIERSQVPTARFGNEKYPRASVTVLNSVRIEELVMVTIAPGITPPVESLIVPEMLPPTAAQEPMAANVIIINRTSLQNLKPTIPFKISRKINDLPFRRRRRHRFTTTDILSLKLAALY